MINNGVTRRAVVGGTAAGLAGALAGCVGAGSTTAAPDADGRPVVAASMAVLGEFARAVGGDAVRVDDLVPQGQHGHGWEPSAAVTARAVDADALVHVGPGFQPWVDRLAATAGEDLLVVPAADGVDLLPFDADSAHAKTDHESEDDHGDHEESGNEHDGHDEHGEHTEEEHEEHTENRHDKHSENGHDEHSEDGHDEHSENGHDGHDEHGEGDEHRGHEHGGTDPHFWLDPTRAAAAVTGLAAGLAPLVGGGGDALAANARGYADSLGELDRTFQRGLADRERDAVLVAGHDAFGYLADRYGFEVHTLASGAPDASPSPAAIQRAQSLVEEHGIRYVLAPAFESSRAAEALVADTDAEGVLPVTALPTYSREWTARGWGYREVMREVNLPSLAAALGA